MKKLPSLKQTANLHLKMDGWNTFSFPFLGWPFFQVRTVSFREGINYTLGDDDVLFVFERKGIRVTKNSWILADVWYPLISG